MEFLPLIDFLRLAFAWQNICEISIALDPDTLGHSSFDEEPSDSKTTAKINS
jgi:hypothetical protein